MVTIRRGVDFVSVQTPREALDVMKGILKHTDIGASEVAKMVAFPTLSVKEVVDVYAAFQYATRDAEVVEFSRSGKRQLWKEVA